MITFVENSWPSIHKDDVEKDYFKNKHYQQITLLAYIYIISSSLNVVIICYAPGHNNKWGEA